MSAQTWLYPQTGNVEMRSPLDHDKVIKEISYAMVDLLSLDVKTEAREPRSNTPQPSTFQQSTPIGVSHLGSVTIPLEGKQMYSYVSTPPGQMSPRRRTPPARVSPARKCNPSLPIATPSFGSGRAGYSVRSSSQTGSVLPAPVPVKPSFAQGTVTTVRSHLEDDIKVEKLAALLDSLIGEVDDYHNQKHSVLERRIEELCREAEIKVPAHVEKQLIDSESKLENLAFEMEAMKQSQRNNFLTVESLVGESRAFFEKEMSGVREEWWKLERSHVAMRKELETMLTQEIHQQLMRLNEMETDVSTLFRRHEATTALRLDSFKVDVETARRENMLPADFVELRRVVRDLADVSRLQGDQLNDIAKGMEINRESMRVVQTPMPAIRPSIRDEETNPLVEFRRDSAYSSIASSEYTRRATIAPRALPDARPSNSVGTESPVNSPIHVRNQCPLGQSGSITTSLLDNSTTMSSNTPRMECASFSQRYDRATSMFDRSHLCDETSPNELGTLGTAEEK